jgi:glycosyltransferase involved in cell wall biosynthesis
MDVFFLIKSSYTPSCRLRVTDLAAILEQNGIRPEIEILAPTFLERRQQYRKASSFPVTILQKRLLKWWDFFLLRKQARILVFDFDDAIYLKNASPSTNPKDYRSSTRERLFRRVVRNVDHVIASTRILAEATHRFAPETPVEIIPSSIKLDEIPPRKHNRIEGRAVVGWTGTTSTFRYIEYVMPALVRIQRETGCRYRFMANARPEFPQLEYEFVQWAEKEEYPTIRTFDVGLMPLSEDPFSLGKASYKLLQYMGLGVPAVCSPVGMNRDVAGNDEFALCATTTDEFAEKLRLLLSDQQLRETLAARARKLVAETYARDIVGVRLANVLKNFAERQTH